MGDSVRATTRAIFKKFHVHHGDNLPFEGWFDSKRETLFELWGELGYKVGAEIGVRMGTNSAAILARVPGVKLYCIDPWNAYLRVTDSVQDRYYERCVRKLAGKNVELIKKTSMDAVDDFKDGSLDFCYLDGRHEGDFIMEDLICWSKKVRRGGMVSGHDLYFFYDSGVIPAVESFCMGNDIKSWFCTREKAPSWFFVKE